jgi:23S rRNA G2445 N2-methylase RlmL
VRLIATCPEETKPALLQELAALGATDLVPGFRAVSFEASDELFYELHLKLRTASRILRVIKDVPAKTPAMLYSQARRIRWQELFDPPRLHGRRASGPDADSGGMPPKQVITQVREASATSFTRAERVPPVDVRGTEWSSWRTLRAAGAC